MKTSQNLVGRKVTFDFPRFDALKKLPVGSPERAAALKTYLGQNFQHHAVVLDKTGEIVEVYSEEGSTKLRVRMDDDGTLIETWPMDITVGPAPKPATTRVPHEFDFVKASDFAYIEARGREGWTIAAAFGTTICLQRPIA
jgi:hypothetical protein